jgi:GntR family transcriptional regulator
MTIDKGNSAIEFRLDPDSGVPTYLQLVQQVEHALRLGYLKPGDQLPKVRDVVTTLTINPNTVLKAYRELEHKGLAAGRPGQGTFIQATLEQVTLPELAGLRRTLLGWLASADTAGLDEDGIVALFTSGLRDFFKTSGGKRSGGVADRAGAAGVADRVGAADGSADRAGAAGRADRPGAAGRVEGVA